MRPDDLIPIFGGQVHEAGGGLRAHIACWRRLSWVMAVVALVLWFSACDSGPDRSTPCGRIEATLLTCETPPLPAALSSLRERCPVYRAERSDDQSVVAVAARNLETCSAMKTCSELRACMEEKGCTWIVDISKPKQAPIFQCW